MMVDRLSKINHRRAVRLEKSRRRTACSWAANMVIIAIDNCGYEIIKMEEKLAGPRCMADHLRGAAAFRN
jgi:hypothetical protein